MNQDVVDLVVLTHLIDIGQTEGFARLELLWLAEQLPRHGNLMRLRPQSWFEVADHYPDEDVIALIRALTVAEQVLPNWRCGSVSPVIWLFKRLQQRHAVPEGLSEWIWAHTDNPYLPDGRLH